MVVTVVIVVTTSNLAIGVVSGVVLSALIFGWRSAKIKAHTTMEENHTKIYRISGQLFFGTMAYFVDLFNVNDDPKSIVIDFSSSHVWDHSAVTAVEKVVQKYDQAGKKVTIIGLNKESLRLVVQAGLVTGINKS
ncbi:putative transporter [compost metagenome]